MAQAGWPKGDWHKFIVPRRARLQSAAEREGQILIFWLLTMQILIPVLCIVPVFLPAAYGAITSTLGRAGPRLFQAETRPGKNRRGSLGTMRHATWLPLAQVLMFRHCPWQLLTEFLFSVSLQVDCLVVLVLAYGIFRQLPSCSFATAISVFCLWRTYLRDCIDCLNMAFVGEKHSEIGSTIVSHDSGSVKLAGGTFVVLDISISMDPS